MIRVFLAFSLFFASPAVAEHAVYGTVELTGLSRENSWPLNPPGHSNAMVCNVNGPDGFLAVRDGPLTDHPIARKFKRLAVLVVDTSMTQDGWVYVTGAYRDTDSNGRPIPHEEFSVTGWASTDYLCDFLD